MKNFIEHRVYTMKKEYENNHLRVVSDFNREREAIEIYKGREILELIQNADDEISLDLSREIRISYIGNILKVSNNGRRN